MAEEFMSFEEFSEIILEMDVVLYAKLKNAAKKSFMEEDGFDLLHKGRLYLGYMGNGKNKYGDKIPPEKWYFRKAWRVGGIAGGNCWTSGGHYSLDGESEPAFDEIDRVLVRVCPNLSFVAYKELMSKLKIEESEYTETEYYGNYTNYSAKILAVKDLYNAIVEVYERAK